MAQLSDVAVIQRCSREPAKLGNFPGKNNSLHYKIRAINMPAIIRRVMNWN